MRDVASVIVHMVHCRSRDCRGYRLVGRGCGIVVVVGAGTGFGGSVSATAHC